MSHFTVLVIGEDAERQLAPYDESIKVPEYIREVVSDEEKMRFLKYYKDEESKKETKKGQFHTKIIASIDEFPTYYQKYGKDWNSNSWKVDVSGIWQEYSTYNPKSKWDWYELGGRWAGQIKLKEDVEFKEPNFSWGWDEKSKLEVLKERLTDSAKKGDIENLDDIITFAVLKDGEWYEEGKMGWWGLVTDSKDKSKWEEEFKKLIQNLPDDTLLSIYDCHI